MCMLLHAAPCRATLHATPAKLGPVLENTLESAGSLPDSEAFLRLGHFGFGRDGLVREAGRMADSMFSTSRPPVALEKAASGFESQSGAKTMTNVISLARDSVAESVHTSAQNLDPISHQAAIENALSMALHHVRGDAPEGLRNATAKANRALSLLKQACAADALTVREG